jgi:hypothetical protein
LLCTPRREYLDTSTLDSYSLANAAVQQLEAFYGNGSQA